MKKLQTKSIICLLCAVLFMSVGYSALAQEKELLDLNTATIEQLAAVPGLNQDLAERIIETREEYGEFVDLEELLDIDGINNSLLRKLKKHLGISGVDGCNC